jgi:hypothetical protein
LPKLLFSGFFWYGDKALNQFHFLALNCLYFDSRKFLRVPVITLCNSFNWLSNGDKVRSILRLVWAEGWTISKLASKSVLRKRKKVLLQEEDIYIDNILRCKSLPKKKPLTSIREWGTINHCYCTVTYLIPDFS